MEKEFFLNNREKLKRDMADREMVILASGKEKYFSGDASYKFRVSKNFYYYTGLNYDNVTYVVFKAGEEIIEKLFFDEISPDKVKWIGSKLTKEEAMDMFPSIKEVNFFNTSQLVKQLKKDISIHEIEKVYLDFLDNPSNIDKPDLTHKDNALRSYLEHATGGAKEFSFVSINELAKLHRPYKEDCEIECIKKAIDYTSRALTMVMKNIKSCKSENEVEAYLDFSVRKDGCTFTSFDPIVACGINGTILHYTDNNAKIERDDLVLLDVGHEYENYASDITRTLPSTGLYTPYQRKIYQIVLDTNKNIINDIKIGMTFKELNDLAKDYLSEGLIREGIIKDKDEISNYYWHNVSHPLGLDTHDLRGETLTIEEGMVITVEPGLYIAETKTGIRIEDDVYVTKKGNIVLTDKVPKEIKDIEEIITEKKY
ncbi:MAG: Xaa-Pro aminopeptidase [Clostridia bacterium]|nr:Xaa-Pro aminopeptidase [Clostridia bacterium]